MASTKLRLLLDESITEPLATYIMQLVPSAVRSRETLGAGAKDPSVASYANSNRRMIVAVDSDFKKHNVEFGVIKLTGPDRATDDCLFAIFRMFWQSGFRGRSRRRRTSLSNEGLRITNGDMVTHTWQPKPCPHHGGANR
jgi:hypothetical protein